MLRNRFGTAPRLLLASIALPAALTAAAAPPQQGAVFDVDSAGDELDAVPGDGACRTASGVCTLRAAVMEANALEGPDTIRLPAGGPGTPTPSLNLAGTGEDDSLSGDLDILDDLTISGGGMMISGAEASGLGDRALHVHAGVTLNLSGVSFANADAGAGQNGGGLLNEGTVAMVETSL